MPGVEIQILSIKLTGIADLGKVRCTFTLPGATCTTNFPFKVMSFVNVDAFSVIQVNVFNGEKVVGMLDIPVNLILAKKNSTFKINEAFGSSEKRKVQGKKSESGEITLAIKQVASELNAGAEKKLEETIEQLDLSYKSRRELQLSIEETTQQLSEMIKTQDNIINKYLTEKQELNERIKVMDECLAVEKVKNLNLNGRCQELEMTVESFKSNEKYFKGIEKWCKDVNTQSEYFQNQQNNLIEKIKNLNLDYQDKIKDYQDKVDSLIDDKAGLMKTIESLQKENFSYKNQNDLLTAELLKLRSKLSGIEGEAISHLSIKSKENELNEKLKSTESLLTSLKDELSRSTSTFKENLNKAISSKNSLITENKELSSRASTLDSILRSKDSEIDKLKQENYKISSEMACIEQHLCVKEDSNQIIDDLMKTNQSLKSENKETKKSLSENFEKVIENSQKVSELEEKLKEMTEENEVLMSAVIKLQKNREVYVPVNGDPVDNALADFINTLDEPLPVPFTREDEGIYLFGTKRIFIKLEQGKIIIRVGGGFMQVHEFIEVYTNTEVEKFAREKAEHAARLRLSIMGKLNEGSPGKYSQCFGVQRRNSSITRTSISPNHSSYYN